MTGGRARRLAGVLLTTAVLPLLASPPPAAAATGGLDPTFGTGPPQTPGVSAFDLGRETIDAVNVTAGEIMAGPAGTLALPTAWGKLSPVSVTLAAWTGRPVPACSAHPGADGFVHFPVGFVGSFTSDASVTETGPTPGAVLPTPTSTQGAGPTIDCRQGAHCHDPV